MNVKVSISNNYLTRIYSNSDFADYSCAGIRRFWTSGRLLGKYPNALRLESRCRVRQLLRVVHHWVEWTPPESRLSFKRSRRSKSRGLSAKQSDAAGRFHDLNLHVPD